MDTTKEYLRILEQIKDGSGLNFLSTPSKDDKDLIERIEENGGDVKGKLLSIEIVSSLFIG